MSKEKIIDDAEKFAKEGKFDKAIREYEKLLAEDPHDMRAKMKVADLQARKKNIAGAIKTYREVADSYAQENFHLKAIAVYKTILKLNPTLTELNEKLGDLYYQVGLDQDAINQYYIVAGFYDQKGKVKESLEIRKKIVQIDPSSTTSRIRLAELMQADGKNDESIGEYEKAAELLTAKKDRNGLIEVYEKILYFRPDNIGMLTELCRIYFEKREYKKALRRLEASPPKIQKEADVLELWAEALLEDRQVDTARRKFRDLYVVLMESHEIDRAQKVYSRILQEFSDDLDYLKELEEIQKNAGIALGEVKPKFRQDFEKTEMVDLSKFDEYLKKK